jgi:ABC-2 type transport system ATP-binding protein
MTVSVDLAVETRALRRTFGSVAAVDGIDLAVPRGSLFGFLGPNGAGKSTTIKCLTGLLRRSGGTVRLLGLDPEADPVEAKRRIGVLPEDLALLDKLSGADHLTFVGRVHRLPRDVVKTRSQELLSLMDLERAARSPVADYSHGMRKKLALAAALLPAPRLLFLDEPFEGIDAVASRQIRDLLREYVRGGGTIFLTSHVLEIVERLCDHVGVIHRGKLVAQGTIESLREGAQGLSLEEIFLDLVGAGAQARGRLAWLCAPKP